MSHLSLHTLEEYLPVSIKEISNPWNMSKDGHHYWSFSAQEKISVREITDKNNSIEEIKKIRSQLFYRWHIK